MMKANNAEKSTWQTVRFGDMVHHISERVQPDDVTVDRYVGLEHLDPESLKISRWGSPEEVGATKLRFYPGDIIFGKRRFYQRKLAIADFEGICSAHAMVLRAKPAVVLPEFLPFFMQSEPFFERAMSISVGSLSPTINWSTLQRQEFALPPLAEQRRIAEVLTAVEDTLESQKLLVDEIEKFTRVIRHHFFSKGWEEKELSKLFHAQLGKMLSKRAKQGKSPKPYLANTNVQWGYIDLSEVREMDFNDDEFEKFKLKKGDLLVCEGGEVGRSAIWEGQIEDCCYQKALHRLRSRTGELHTELMLQFMYYASRRGDFAALTGHSTIAHLTMVKLKGLKVPVPPQEVQMKMIDVFGHLQESAETALANLNNTIALKKSLLGNFIG